MSTHHKKIVLLVTGLSGAGMSTALKGLEDLGYEVIDNLPIALVASAVEHMEQDGRPLAIGIDCRTRDFDAHYFLDTVNDVKKSNQIDVKVALITCSDFILQQRFSETRRRHPLAVDRSIIDGIEKERELLAPIFQNADETIDTSEFSVHDLRRTIAAKFRTENAYGLMTFVTSFGFRNGVPRDADLVFDVRFLWNPHYDPELKPLTGKDKKIQQRLSREDGFISFFANLTRMLEDLLPRYSEEGKSYLTIGIGCTGGRHRSVFVAEQLYEWLDQHGYSIAIKHRDLEKWVLEQKKRGDTIESKAKG